MSTSSNRPLKSVQTNVPVETAPSGSAPAETSLKSLADGPLSELKTLRERNVELMSRISKLRADNKELANAATQRSYDGERHAEELETIRIREAELTADFTRLTALCSENSQQMEEDQRTIKKLQSSIKEEKAVGAYLVRQFDKKADDLRAEASAANERWLHLENSLRKEIESIATKCNELEAAVREREATITQLRSALSNHEVHSETTQSDLKRKLAKSADESWAKDLEVQRLVANEAVFMNQITQLNTTIGQKAQQVAKSQEELEGLQAKLTSAEHEASSLRERARAHAKALAQAQAQGNEAVQQVRAETAREISLLRTENTEFKEKIAVTIEENSHLRVENADQRGQVRAAQEEMPRLRTECNETRAALRLSQEQATQLRETVSLQQVEAQHAKLEAERQYSAAKAEAASQLKDLKAQAEQAVQRVKAEADLIAKTLETEQAQAIGELKAEFAGELKSKEIEIVSIRAEHGLELKTQANEFETVRESFERKVARMSDQFEVERENSRASSMKLMGEINSVRAEANEAIARYKAAVTESDQKTSAYNKSVEEFQIQKMRLESRLTELTAKNKLEFERFHSIEITLRTEIAALATDLEQKSRQLTEQEQRSREIMDATSKKLDRSQDECLELMQEIERLQQQVKAQASTVATQKDQLIELAEKRREIEIMRAELASQSRMIVDLKHVSENKEAMIEKATEEAERFRTQLEEQASRFARLSERAAEKARHEVEALQNSIRIHQSNSESTRTEMIEMTRAMADMKHTFDGKDIAVFAANEETARVRASIEEQAIRFERAAEKIADKTRSELDALNANLRQLQMGTENQRTEIIEHSRTISELKYAIDQREKAIHAANMETSRLQVAIEDQALRFEKTADKSGEKARLEIESLQATLRQTQRELEAQRSEMVEQSCTITELNRTNEVKERNIAQINDEASRLRIALEEQATRFEAAAAQANEKGKNQIASLQASLRASFEQKDEASEQLQKVLDQERVQLETRMKQVNQQADELENRGATVSDQSSQVAAREHQLRHYASALSREKADLMKFSKKIAAEIQMVSATHPLKDYLTTTEYELSKVEVQLKTTPMLSPERARLEAAVSQLIEQREFLKMILANAQKQFDGQIATLEKMVSAGNFQPVPPPPPVAAAKKTVSRAATQAAPLASGAPASVNGPTVEAAPAPAATPEEVRVQWQNTSQDLE